MPAWGNAPGNWPWQTTSAESAIHSGPVPWSALSALIHSAIKLLGRCRQALLKCAVGASPVLKHSFLRRMPFLLVQGVNFNHTYPGGVTRAADDGGVLGPVRRQDLHNRRFQIVRGRDGAVDNGLLVRAIHPVVVGLNETTVLIAQFQRRISEFTGNAQGRTY